MSAKEPVEDIDSDEEENVKAVEPEPVVEEDSTLNNCEVITKYQEAAKIAQAVLAEVAALCVPGAKIVDICKHGDTSIETKTAAIFKGKNKAGKAILKGIAFPVCLSVNECVCHCSPLESEESVSCFLHELVLYLCVFIWSMRTIRLVIVNRSCVFSLDR